MRSSAAAARGTSPPSNTSPSKLTTAGLADATLEAGGSSRRAPGPARSADGRAESVPSDVGSAANFSAVDFTMEGASAGAFAAVGRASAARLDVLDGIGAACCARAVSCADALPAAPASDVALAGTPCAPCLPVSLARPVLGGSSARRGRARAPVSRFRRPASAPAGPSSEAGTVVLGGATEAPLAGGVGGEASLGEAPTLGRVSFGALAWVGAEAVRRMGFVARRAAVAAAASCMKTTPISIAPAVIRLR